MEIDTVFIIDVYTGEEGNRAYTKSVEKPMAFPIQPYEGLPITLVAAESGEYLQTIERAKRDGYPMINGNFTIKKVSAAFDAEGHCVLYLFDDFKCDGEGSFGIVQVDSVIKQLEQGFSFQQARQI